MDLKTQKRIAQFKAKERRARSEGREPKTSAERQRDLKLKAARKKRPGFGSSVTSVADHLNEVVGLTERKVSKREERDKRIEAAAKRGAGCRRFEVAGIESGAAKFVGQGQALAARPQARAGGGAAATTRSAPLSRPRAQPLQPSQQQQQQQQRMREARNAFLARLEGAGEQRL